MARDQTSKNIKQSMESRRFASNNFRKQGVEGKFNQVDLSQFTFGAITFTAYSGQRRDILLCDGCERKTSEANSQNPVAICKRAFSAVHRRCAHPRQHRSASRLCAQAGPMATESGSPVQSTDAGRDLNQIVTVDQIVYTGPSYTACHRSHSCCYGYRCTGT